MAMKQGGGYALDDDQDNLLSGHTLKDNPSLFFEQMDNLVASDRLQHTPSMMELPSNTLRDIIREYDEEVNRGSTGLSRHSHRYHHSSKPRYHHGYNGHKSRHHGRSNGHLNGFNGNKSKKIKDNNDNDDSDEAEEEEYEYYYENYELPNGDGGYQNDYYDDDDHDEQNNNMIKESQSQPDSPINDINNSSLQNGSQSQPDSPASAQIPDLHRPSWHSSNHGSSNKSSSNIRINGLPLKPHDSEEYENNHSYHKPTDSTPIVKRIQRPPPPPQHVIKKQMDKLETRRRSDGLTKITENAALIKQIKPSALSQIPQDIDEIDDEDDDDGIFSDDALGLLSDDETKYDDDDDEEEDDDDAKTGYESNGSHTMDLDEDKWIEIPRIIDDDDNKNNNNNDILGFAECNIRFEEDDWSDGKKPPASEFCSLRFFYQFIYDRFHLYSQFLLDTSLPMYPEWKKMRKVRIRNASLKTVDYALKSCLECVDSIKAVVRNCIILNIDNKQPNKRHTFKQCSAPKILSTTFNIGDFSIMAAWDLFDNGSTPSINDWTIALSLDHGIPQKLSQCLPDLSHLNAELKTVSTLYHLGKQYKFNIIEEFLNENKSFLKFGNGPIDWKLIKNKFVSKHGIKYNNNILKAFDTISYYINPPLNKLNELMNDKNDKFVSRRRIIAEPIMWLFYMVSLLIERQQKLQNLYITAMSFKGDNNNRGQKLNALITNLAKQAKDESERLRAIMAKLPAKDDLKQTLIQLVKDRDPEEKLDYTRSLKQYRFEKQK